MSEENTDDLDFVLRSGATGLDSISENQRHDYLLNAPYAINVNLRLEIAASLKPGTIAEARQVLEMLLHDTDALVRRVAAESLYGAEASRSALADKFNYASVLLAEQKGPELLKVIAAGNPREAFNATRSLIALKRDAWCLLGKAMQDRKDSGVALSAAYARQQIEFANPNPDPAWVSEVQKKLSRPISFDFKDTPIIDAFAQISKMIEVPIDVSEMERRENWKSKTVTLRVTDFSGSVALEWIMRLADCEYTLNNRRVIVKEGVIACGSVSILLDVRDLEFAGFTPNNWELYIKQNVPDLIEGGGLRDYVSSYNGILLCRSPMIGLSSAGAGQHWVKPLVEHLNKLRAGRGLEPVFLH